MVEKKSHASIEGSGEHLTFACRQIAFELGATERTIKAHRHMVMEKMDALSLAELVLIARRLGHS
jgi:FixJ family two-component response regulator